MLLQGRHGRCNIHSKLLLQDGWSISERRLWVLQLHGVPAAPVVLLASTLAVIGGAGARLAAIAEEL